MEKGSNYNAETKKNPSKSHNNYSTINSEIMNKIHSIQDYTQKGNFGKIIITAKSFKKDLSKINHIDEQKYLKSMSKHLEKASKTAEKYFEKNRYIISDKKHHEISKLIDFSEEFKKEHGIHKVSRIEKTLRTFSFTAIGFSILSNSTKLTGNVISSSNFEEFSFLGTTLFFMGVVGAFLTRKK